MKYGEKKGVLTELRQYLQGVQKRGWGGGSEEGGGKGEETVLRKPRRHSGSEGTGEGRGLA